jgi:hypothetical protein
MLRACAKAVYRLWIAGVQAAVLCTQSTAGTASRKIKAVLYGAAATGFAQLFKPFTQPVLGKSHQLNEVLCPLSTRPMTNTNLIKE